MREPMTIQEMSFESYMLKNKRSEGAIRKALLTGKLKGEKHVIDDRLTWVAEKQDFLEWLERSRK